MDLEQKSIERIKMASEMSLHHYGKPLICTYSGGKDSDVMLELFKRSGVPFEVSHGLTTVDAPSTVQHIKETFARLEEAGITATIHQPKMRCGSLSHIRRCHLTGCSVTVARSTRKTSIPIALWLLEYDGPRATRERTVRTSSPGGKRQQKKSC